MGEAWLGEWGLSDRLVLEDLGCCSCEVTQETAEVGLETISPKLSALWKTLVTWWNSPFLSLSSSVNFTDWLWWINNAMGMSCQPHSERAVSGLKSIFHSWTSISEHELFLPWMKDWVQREKGSCIASAVREDIFLCLVLKLSFWLLCQSCNQPIFLQGFRDISPHWHYISLFVSLATTDDTWAAEFRQ